MSTLTESEPGSYIEDDPAAWAAFLQAVRRYGEQFAAMTTHLGTPDGAAEVLAGAMLSYLAAEHGVFISRATPVADTAGIDAARLATAICASRPPEPAKDSDLFVDDECHGLAIRVVAEYERLSVAVTPKHSAAWLAATKPDSLAAALRAPKPEGEPE